MALAVAVDRRQRSRSVFEIYLRTGRRVVPRNTSYRFELKFNPWHDTSNGQFTFSGGGGRSRGGGSSGSWTPGGGGGFGGGGSSGSWAKPNPSRVPAAPTAVVQPRHAPVAARPSAVAPALPNDAAKLRQLQTVNGYHYDIDAKGRTQHISGTLRLNPDQSRSPGAQLGAGGSDRLPTDHGGHYIARRFDGPTEAFNHFAQDGNFNQSGYRALENRWAKVTGEGKQVFVEIRPRYVGASQRPVRINVTWTINGHSDFLSFPNSPRGKTHGN